MHLLRIENKEGLVLAEIPCTYAQACSMFYKSRVGIFGKVKVWECDEMGNAYREIAKKEGTRSTQTNS